MQPSMRQGLAYAWLLLLTVVVGWIAWRQCQPAEDRRFRDLTVQRLSVVEPDGKPRVVIASRARMPNAYWHGKPTAHKSNGSGGFLFFNDEGSEAGGMGFSAGRTGDRFGATSNLNFDQYDQDNTLQLIYQDDNGQRMAGLGVKDRPNLPIGPAIDLVDAIKAAKDPAERLRLQGQFDRMVKLMAPGTANRFFAGKELDDSIVRLSDKQGRPRLVMKVDGSGRASIEFLDTAGKVTRRVDGG